MIREVHSHYTKIVNNEETAKFLQSKKVSVNFNKRMSDDELWRIHKQSLKKAPSKKSVKKSLLDLKIELGERMLKKCELCERKCMINRHKTKGFCGVGPNPRVFGAHTHWGEESFITPSATIFFAGCTMKCLYCQNAPESITYKAGEPWNPLMMAEWMKDMRLGGCRNINLVGGDPTPNVPAILKALKLLDVNIPIIFNSNAYCSSKCMELLSKVIDLYLFDFRYFSDACGMKLSDTRNYPEIAARNHKLAVKRGDLLVRVLIIPNHVECDAVPIIKWLAENVKGKAVINVMSQYRPCFKAYNYPEINRCLTSDEFKKVYNLAKKLGLKLI